jgi:ketosteroid isomerase-like protein
MATKNVETQVQELLDREAIRDLPLRYCHAVWTKNLEGIVNLFTEDGAIWITGREDQKTQGRENLHKMYGGVMVENGPRPFIHNHVIDLHAPDRATGTCYLEIRQTRDDKSWIAAGYYNDEYAKVGDQWKFKSRKVTMYYSAPLLEGWAERAAKRAKSS